MKFGFSDLAHCGRRLLVEVRGGGGGGGGPWWGWRRSLEAGPWCWVAGPEREWEPETKASCSTHNTSVMQGEIMGKKHKHFHSKKTKQTAEASVAISLFKKSFCSSSCCFNVPFHPHYSLLNVPLLANARNYCLLIFKLHWCWLHLRSLFTSTFNLPGGWVWLQGTILTSLSDNQTKLALKLLSCDCLKFLDTHWIWQMLLRRNYNVI